MIEVKQAIKTAQDYIKELYSEEATRERNARFHDQLRRVIKRRRLHRRANYERKAS